MKISKLLNRINYLIILIFLLTSISHAEDTPVDIWNIKEGEKEVNFPTSSKKKDDDVFKKQNTESSIYQMQSKKETDSIKLDENIISKDPLKLGFCSEKDLNKISEIHKKVEEQPTNNIVDNVENNDKKDEGNKLS